MREIVKTIQVFKYNELSDSAKSNARIAVSNLYGFMHEGEAIETLKELAEAFRGSIDQYEIDWSNSICHSTMSFKLPDEYEMSEEEIKEILDSLGEYNPKNLKGVGDCKLTGVCYDEDAIDGFRIAWHEGERELPKLMEAAFRSLMKVCNADYEAFYDDDEDAFSDFTESNDLEFLENGEIYP